MFVRLIALGLLCAGQLAAQAVSPAPATANPPNGPAPQQRPTVEGKVQQLQQDLRERDAIIRNLLERVSELEKKVNGKSLDVRYI